MNTNLRLAAALLLTAILTSCAGPSSPAAVPTASAAPSSFGAALSPVDWSAPELTSLTDGWTLGPCEGDAPYVCFRADGELRGIAELVSFPVETLPTVRAALAEGPHAALQAHVREHLDVFRQDRTSGCGAGYEFRPDETQVMSVAGQPVVRSGFRGGSAGSTTEHVVRYVTLKDDHLVSLVVNSTGDGACSPGELELTPAELAALEPVLDRLVAVSPLPVPATPDAA